MDRFLSIEAFVRVAEASSFAEAARQLGVTSSVVTNRIQQLEKFVNAPLFHRSTRHVRLSDVGETFYRECAEVVGRVNELVSVAEHCADLLLLATEKAIIIYDVRQRREIERLDGAYGRIVPLGGTLYALQCRKRVDCMHCAPTGATRFVVSEAEEVEACAPVAPHLLLVCAGQLVPCR